MKMIRRGLAALIVVCVVPAAALSAALMLENFRLQRDIAYRDTELMARSFASDIDRTCGPMLDAQQMAAIISADLLPPEWFAGIFSADGKIIARTPPLPEGEAKVASKQFIALAASKTRGTFESVSREGIPVVSSFDHSRSGWGVSVAVPKSQLFAGIYRSLLLVAVGIAAAGVCAVLLVKRAAASVIRLANHDRLTDCCNRAMFYDIARRQVVSSSRSDGKFAVLLIDLDGFKAVNDVHGHGAGDRVLEQAARRIVGCVRTEDTVARLGGDEFAVLLRSADRAVAELVRGKISASLTRPYSDITMPVSASIGIAVFPPGSVDELLQQADTEMYASKATRHGEAGFRAGRYAG